MPGRMLRNVLGAAILLPVPLLAQEATLTCDRHGDGEEARYCEMRDVTLAAHGPIAIDAGPNGAIRVHGWDRNEIRLFARVETHARSDDRAEEIAHDVEVVTNDGIHATGPRADRREWWSVSFEAFVPARSDLNLETTNGSIRIADVAGRIQFEVVNGSVQLARLGGDVSGHSTNGSIGLTLAGTEWSGTGLDVRTTNGSVRIAVPEGFSAHVETGTTNGHLRLDFPVTVQGNLNRQLAFDLGRGGKPIRVRTTNGSVVLARPEG
jgi:hypothetical protein